MRFIPGIVLGTLLLVSCGNGDAPGSTQAPDTPTPLAAAATATEAPVAETRFGVAGLIPPHWPESSEHDWRALFEGFDETGALVGAYQAWDQHEPIAMVYHVAGERGIVPVVALGVTRDLPGGGLEPQFDPAADDARRAFIDAAVDVVSEYAVEYLLVSTEVDRLHDHDPDAFDAFVSLYTETYEAVKAVSPETMVFTAFQLEMLRGDAALSGREFEERWHVLDRFEGYMDLVGFTTFPFLEYEDPADIPEDYYEAIARHTDLPVAFTEIGWPSAPLSVAPDSPHGGDPEQQAAFVRRFVELTDVLDVRIALWAFPHDPGAGVLSTFESIGLRENDGTPKPALEAWKGIAHR